METSGLPPVRRFTADEAMRMVELGIVGEDEHVELLDGAFVEVGQQGPEQAYATTVLSDRLRGVYRGHFQVREEKPLAAGEHDLPEPDVAIFRGGDADYWSRHPSGRDSILVVELALSSQSIDRRKASVYAAAGVPVYWLVDLAARRLELRTTPVDGAYQVTRILAEDDVVELPASNERWAVRDLLPPP
ncbi:MAG TPA: Uma2 family endonuclease [Polyangia bacterium]|jgi:Uma2 family endonuclease